MFSIPEYSPHLLSGEPFLCSVTNSVHTFLKSPHNPVLPSTTPTSATMDDTTPAPSALRLAAPEDNSEKTYHPTHADIQPAGKSPAITIDTQSISDDGVSTSAPSESTQWWKDWEIEWNRNTKLNRIDFYLHSVRYRESCDPALKYIGDKLSRYRNQELVRFISPLLALTIVLTGGFR